MRACHHAAVAWTLLALSVSVASGACKKSDASTTPMADVTASEHGFTPASLKLAQGGPGSHASVTFVRTTDKTCATEVVFPDLKIEQKLPLNQVVSVDVPTDKAGTLTFQCGMAMYKGALVVTEKKP
ncbi:MAG TPA: cupredoxin domain-containing protein [Polyangiaceae bacterium]|jgi:plastocyanin domain-containing protein